MAPLVKITMQLQQSIETNFLTYVYYENKYRPHCCNTFHSKFSEDLECIKFHNKIILKLIYSSVKLTFFSHLDHTLCLGSLQIKTSLPH